MPDGHPEYSGWLSLLQFPFWNSGQLGCAGNGAPNVLKQLRTQLELPVKTSKADKVRIAPRQHACASSHKSAPAPWRNPQAQDHTS